VRGHYGGFVRVGQENVPVLARKYFEYDFGEPPFFPVYAAPLGWVDIEPYLCGHCDVELLFARVGGVEYGSPIVAVEGGPVTPVRPSLTATPNPAGGEVTIRLLAPAGAEVRVEALDALGRRAVLIHDGPLPAGESVLRLDTSGLPRAVYLLRAVGPGWTAWTPLVAR
jgi:hypothetical protein